MPERLPNGSSGRIDDTKPLRSFRVASILDPVCFSPFIFPLFYSQHDENMAVTVSDVKAVAALARLELSEGEEERLTGELNRILEYMEKLKELDTEDVEPTSHVVPITGAFRRDEVVPFEQRERLAVSAPQLDQGYFRVPRIID
jgi:aspartyl-tRNA(Asn)/glutamyl-tRNA(Gln) amidotransferase subunit C